MPLYGDYNSEPTWRETFRKFWPDVQGPQGAEHAVHLAVYSYGWMVALQTVFVLVPLGWNPWVLAEIVILGLVGFFVRRRSFIFAVVGFVYFVASWLVTLFSEATGLIFLMVSAFLFVGMLNGIRGVVALRKQQHNA